MNVMRIFYRTNKAIISCDTKVNLAEPAKIIYSSIDTDQVKSLNWITSLRKNFLLTDSSILLGRNTLERHSIIKVECYRFRSILLVQYIVLKLALQNGSFVYIGMNDNIEILESIGVDYVHKVSKVNLVHYFLFASLILFLIYIYF